MTRTRWSSRSACLVISLLGAGLLLLTRPVPAQMTVDGPPTPTTHALTAWFAQHVPAKFQPHDRFEVQALSDADMDDYLRAGDTDDSDPSNHDDDDQIDGVFVDHPAQIVLRVPESGRIDYFTFSHEYGHYVWFDLLTKDDRKRYKDLYERQKSAHKLVTEYASESVEEGFAEAFATDMTDPSGLSHQDSLSFQFLSRWTIPPPTPRLQP